MDYDSNGYLGMRDLKISEPISHQKIGYLEILIHWIIMISEKNNLNTKTIELASILIKIYISKNQIQQDSLQLVGIASLMIAVKFNECQTQINMNIDDCASQCNFEFSSTQILEMEMSILSLVEYDVNITTITDYYNGQTVHSDLILFVTLDSDFLYYKKYELFEAIENFYSKDTQSIPIKIQNVNIQPKSRLQIKQIRKQTIQQKKKGVKIKKYQEKKYIKEKLETHDNKKFQIFCSENMISITIYDQIYLIGEVHLNYLIFFNFFKLIYLLGNLIIQILKFWRQTLSSLQSLNLSQTEICFRSQKYIIQKNYIIVIFYFQQFYSNK
ncbi:unnamed protein product [Paramecium sonneborni]|uniref:Cyclin-like domain-containing protein n=1 Tax=Paramecium sonneborni TaxID=65129 RepID=A0A8S1L5R9_9CILI|nr:unnamed protein product [Paramecium sonneborni]